MKVNLKKSRIIISLIIILGIIVYVCSSKITFSKYFESVKGRGVGEVAAPIFHIEYGEDVSITNENVEAVYFFSIKNYDEINTSQVDMRYQILIENNLSDVDIKLFKEDEEVSLKNGITNFIDINKEPKKDDYKIVITYNGSLHKVQNDMIKLNVYAEQKV